MLPRCEPHPDHGPVLHTNVDTHILAAHDRVDWRDGSQLQLQRVLRWGLPDPLHRALQVDGQWALVSLARVAPDLADDMRCHFRGDHAGLIRFTLRGRWASAGAFVDHVRPHLQPLKGLDRRLHGVPA